MSLWFLGIGETFFMLSLLRHFLTLFFPKKITNIAERKHIDMKKTLILSLLAALALSLPQHAEGQNILEGTWQLCYPIKKDGGAQELNYVPIWKTFAAPDKFYVIQWRSPNTPSFISTSGTYTFDSDSTFTEEIGYSSSDSDLKGGRTHIKFHMISSNMLLLRYRLPGRETEGTELWRRVLPITPAEFQAAREERGRTKNEIKDQNDVYFVPEKQPEFIGGGEQGLVDYIRENLVQPQQTKGKNMGGRCLLRFIVGKDGNVRDIRVIRSAGEARDKEAIRVAEGLHFKPGQYKGKDVECYVTLPILFDLTERK